MPVKSPLDEISANTKKTVDILKKQYQNQSDNTEEKKDINEKEKENVKKDEVNLLTWGMLGKKFTNSVSEWSKERMEQSGFISRSLKITTGIWTGFTDTFLKYFKDSFSKITSHFREVLGPVAEMFDTALDFLKNTYSFGKKLYTAAFGKNPEDKFRNKLLMEIRDYWHDTFKKNARDDKDETKKPNKLIAGILLGLGLVIGSVVGMILAPFRLLLSVLKKIKPIAIGMEKFFGEGSKFGTTIAKISNKFKTLTKPISLFFGKFKIFGKILEIGGRYLKPLTTGLKIGFKTLGWPLTILLGIIDGIKGFFKASGEGATLSESFIAGLKSAFLGFFDSFVSLFTWAVGKIFGWSDGKTKEVYQNIMKTIGNLFDGIVNYTKTLTKGIWNIITSIVGFFTGANGGEAIISAIKSAWLGFLNMFVNMWTGLIGKIFGWSNGKVKEVSKNVMSFFSKSFDNVFNIFNNVFNIFNNIITNIYNLITNSIEFLKGNNIKNLIDGMFDGISNIFTWLKENVLGWFSEKINNVYQKIMKIFSNTFDSIHNFIVELSKGILNFVSHPIDFVKNLFNKNKVKETPKINPAELGNYLSQNKNDIIKNPLKTEIIPDKNFWNNISSYFKKTNDKIDKKQPVTNRQKYDNMFTLNNDLQRKKNEIEKIKLNQNQKHIDLLKEENKRRELNDKKINDNIASTGEAINIMNQNNNNSKSSYQQIPDEIDGSLIGLELIYDM